MNALGENEWLWISRLSLCGWEGGEARKKKQGKKNLPDLKLHPFSVSLFHTPSGKKINSQLLDF